MSGVTEVRLYRKTVDEVPAEYTNVTAVVLISSTKNHATGVKRYLDGVTTVSGLDPGTNYFWVELIDTRGNTAGPQPAGSYTTPTVWEFYIASVPNWTIIMFSIEGTFGITDDNLSMSSGWRQQDNSDTPVEVSATNGVNKRLPFSNESVGKKLWTIVDMTMSESHVFTVIWRKQAHTPGVEIRMNGVTVTHVESSRGLSVTEFEKTYEIAS
jgi:hypothetical protein